MGCISSKKINSSITIDEKHQRNKTGLQLMSCKLDFQLEQLRKLDDYFKQLAGRERRVSSDSAKIESRVERLVQRLVVGAGNLDPRFAATFIVSLNEPRRIKLRFEYVLRLDALSEGELSLSVDEDSAPAGYARIKLRTGDAGAWAEFVGQDGRLRRDLIKAKLAALLAAAVKRGAIDGADERLCMVPGQIVEADVLDRILKQPEHCRLFYGPAAADAELPEINDNDNRIAIVEDEAGVVLKISLKASSTSKTSRDIEARLLIGASFDSWPTRADYPRRVALHHWDALLHYGAARTGTYAVASAPRHGLRCEDRPSLWRVRMLAAEATMRHHYCDESVPRIVDDAVMHVIDQLRGRLTVDFFVQRKQQSARLRLVSRHIIRSIIWWSLEERAGPDPLSNWSPDQLSRHVLVVLDELLRALRCQNLRCYFQPGCNVMIQCARGGHVQSENHYASDARLIESYLTALHAYSAEWLIPADNDNCQLLTTNCCNSAELLERELIVRWHQVLATLPKTVNGSNDNCCGYTSRQLQYVGLLVGEVLRAKESLARDDPDARWSTLLICDHSQSTTTITSESTDNLIYLIRLTLRQARDQAARTVTTAACRRSAAHHRSKDYCCMRRQRGQRQTSCAKAFFERSVDVLVDIVRRDRETAYTDLEDHVVMARTLVKWLHYGMEEDKKVLGPLLRPYLARLSSSARENAWHVESWRNRRDNYNAEARSLGLFCKLVSSRELLPANGIVEALSRGWRWAENVARTIERCEANDGLRLVFHTPERVLRYELRFTDDGGPGSFSTWSRARSFGSATRRASTARALLIGATDTLPGLSRYFSVGECRKVEGASSVSHVELRDASPLTHVATMARRRGRQRGPGGLIPALVTLNKFRVLQEAAQVLPSQEERTEMLELVQRAQRGAARRQRRASCPDHQLHQSISRDEEPRQVYTPKSESTLHDESMGTTSKAQIRHDASRKRRKKTREPQRLIMERQMQLRREISEIHDTLSRGLRSRSQLPSWDDSVSMASSTTLSAGSLGRVRPRKQRTPIWGDDGARSTWSLWDSVSCNSTFARVRPDVIETTMTNKETNNGVDLQNLANSGSTAEESLVFAGDKDEDYIVIGNETREISK